MSPKTTQEFAEIREESRQRIMQAAARLFADHGFEKSSIRMIACEAGISQGLMYNYFKSKNDLLLNIFNQGIEDALISFTENDSDSSQEKLEHIIRDSFKTMQNHKDFWTIFYSLRNQENILKELPDDIRYWPQNIQKQIKEHLQALDHPHPESTAWLIFITIDGLAQHWSSLSELFPLDELLEALIQTYTHSSKILMSQPNWLNRREYPFSENYVDLEAGHMHYVKEGQGEPIVMVHGIPSWSFTYRHFIKQLSSNYLCIAPDNLGFGLSSKPKHFAYTPQAHAQNLEELINTLELKNITLMVHGLGGPIGLAYALKNPENVKRIIIFNTWMWHDKRLEQAYRFFNNSIGTFLYKRSNFLVKLLVKNLIFANKSKVTSDICEHYITPFSTASSRKALWAPVQTAPETNQWFDDLWQKREVISGKPTLFLWGIKDKLLPLSLLAQWEKVFTSTKIARFKAGHFIQEEVWEEALAYIRTFMKPSTEH